MKSIFKYLIPCIAFAMPLCMVASNKLIDKEKVIEHTYSITESGEVHLDNQFGDIEIKYWNKNEVGIHVLVSVSAANENKAQDILDGIEVEHNKEGGSVYVETDIRKNLTSNNGKGKNKSYKNEFSIDYTIHMPATLELDLKNSFGGIQLGDHIGSVSIDLQFGELEAGHLESLEELDLQFGKAEIRELNGGELDIQFSSINIDDANNDLDIHLSFCKNSTIRLGKNVRDLYLNVEHSTLDIDLPQNLSAEFDISTSFGKLKNNSDYDIKDITKKNKYGPNFDHEYRGTAGSGNVEVRIKGSFSTVTLQ